MLIFVSGERPVNYSSVDSWAGIPTPQKPPNPSSMNIQFLAFLGLYVALGYSGDVEWVQRELKWGVEKV